MMVEPNPDLDVRAQASLAEFRSSLKWLVAAAGAVAATLVAGIQLTALPAENLASVKLWTSVGALVIALILVFTFLRSSVLIMTLPRPTASELSKREQRSNAARAQACGEEIDDPVIRSLYTQKSYFFGKYESIEDLYDRDYVQARDALSMLVNGEEATWRNRIVKTTDAEKSSLTTAIEEAAVTIPTLESIAHLELTRSEYRSLVNKFLLFGIVFVLAVCAFAIATRPAPKPAADITTPAKVRILIEDRSKTGMPPECDVKELSGFAVGGTWDKATVITEPTALCRGAVITDGKGILVVPIASTNGTIPASSSPYTPQTATP